MALLPLGRVSRLAQHRLQPLLLVPRLHRVHQMLHAPARLQEGVHLTVDRGAAPADAVRMCSSLVTRVGGEDGEGGGLRGEAHGRQRTAPPRPRARARLWSVTRPSG